MNKHVTAYLHTHWDREWYREFEVFRMRLIRVFDNVLDMLLKNKIPSFYFDGQMCALEDYLEIRPERKDDILALIKHKKLFVGPFYCLTDEFLTDKTCFVKNLELGMKKAIEYGCTDFIGYFADTFGHSQNVTDILRDFGIDKCIVWRGCSENIPSEFKWCGTDTVNLVRGYFHDVFSAPFDINKKAELLKKEFDLISEKSDGNNILFPIGADHLGVESDICDQISQINDILSGDYYITLGSPFDYFKRVENNFKNFSYNGELRDNSRTFTLQGCYSSRIDLKRQNAECIYKLDLVSRLTDKPGDDNYNALIDYAYKMLLKNQAHDSICGCSTTDVHNENLVRYKKVLQIADGIIDEFKLENNFNKKRILNLSGKNFSGIIQFDSTSIEDGYEQIAVKKGFDKYLLTDTQRIPATEDYTNIYTYLAEVANLPPDDIEFIMPANTDSDLKAREDFIENSHIGLAVKNNEVYVNGLKVSLLDFADMGDSYNFGPKADDYGTEFKVLRSKLIMNTPIRAILKIDFESSWDIVSLFVTIDKNAAFLGFRFDWENTRKNHLLEVNFELQNPITKVWSEDMNTLIKREYDPDYDIRKNLPEEKGIEVKNNTAPMQRGLLIDDDGNNIGVITRGLNQYEVFKNNLLIPILRATGQISNPQNPARTTPAGPPIETDALQMIGHNTAELYVFFGNENDFNSTLNHVYNYIVV